MADGGKNKKYGRNKIDAARYEREHRLERNKVRSLARHLFRMELDAKYSQCVTVSNGLKHPVRPVRFIPTAAPVFNTTETNMRRAMLASLTKPDVNRKLGRIVVNAEAKHHPGSIKMGKGWNAHLSKRTYEELRVRCGL